MRPTLRAVSARLIVGHLDADAAAGLLATLDVRGKPITFALAEPDGLGVPAAVPAGMAADAARHETLRWGKLVIETVANEALTSVRPELCEAIVDGLRVAHRRLGPQGLDIVPRDSSGIGFCAATMVEGGMQLVVVPPAQVFVVHQGVALCIPSGEEVGRGIWMRNDLRAEIFAGIGGAHDPDIRLYDAAIGPGDSLVLTSASLARMLTEEDVRLAVAYEEAATGAERLRQLGLQRGVESGVALVVEIAGSFEPLEESGASGAMTLPGGPRSALRIDMPPIGSIFSTARDWLLEAVDRAQTGQASAPSPAYRREAEDDSMRWPARPVPGHWRKTFQAGARPADPDPQIENQALAAPPAAGHRSSSPQTGGDTVAAVTGGNYSALAPGWRQQARPAPHRSHPLSLARITAGTARQWHSLSRWRPKLARQQANGSLTRSPSRGGGKETIASAVITQLSRFDLRSKRHLLLPVLALLTALLIFAGITRTIKAQQARQVQQRFDSLVTAASQLEAQARTDGDRNETQGLVRRSQALLDQAATLRPDQARVAALRKDLLDDLDRLDSVVSLPEPVVLGNFATLGKDVSAASMVADSSAMYVVDGAGQRVLQLPRQTRLASAIAAKGDKSGANQLGAPKLLATRDAGLLVLDANRNLWSYSAPTQKITQIGLKSADTWKDATAMAAYGPNLYVLDAVLGNVFRYASRDGIFTEAPSRFFEKDNPDLLRQAVSLTIDGSIWALTADGQIFKLENAARQPFTVTGLPQPIARATQIVTQAGYHSLYVLDAGNNRVVEIGKDGRYLRQFNLKLPAAATSFWPDEAAHQLQVLAGNTVYQFELPA